MNSLKITYLFKVSFFFDLGQGNTSCNLWNVVKRQRTRQTVISQYSQYSDSYIYRLLAQKEPLRSHRIFLNVMYRVHNPDIFSRSVCTVICFLIHTRQQQFWLFYFPGS